MSEGFFNALKAEFLVEGGKALLGIVTAGASKAVEKKVEEKMDEIGGKKTFTDEKWLDYTRRVMNPKKREIWDREIHPALLKDFGDGFFSRIGYIDAATQIRLNLEAKAQEDIPVIKMEFKNDKGKVVKVVTRPVTSTKPLSAWCLENYVDLYQKIIREHKKNGLSTEDAKDKAISELRTIMRDAGFAVGQSPALYQGLDDFVAVVPEFLRKALDVVKNATQYTQVTAQTLAKQLGQWVVDRDKQIKDRRANLGWFGRLLEM